jgi:hypothetical protein
MAKVRRDRASFDRTTRGVAPAQHTQTANPSHRMTPFPASRHSICPRTWAHSTRQSGPRAFIARNALIGIGATSGLGWTFQAFCLACPGTRGPKKACVGCAHSITRARSSLVPASCSDLPRPWGCRPCPIGSLRQSECVRAHPLTPVGLNSPCFASFPADACLDTYIHTHLREHRASGRQPRAYVYGLSFVPLTAAGISSTGPHCS